jgi:hypothetical protein
MAKLSGKTTMQGVGKNGIIRVHSGEVDDFG